VAPHSPTTKKGVLSRQLSVRVKERMVTPADMAKQEEKAIDEVKIRKKQIN
jgi:hypothetical protein